MLRHSNRRRHMRQKVQQRTDSRPRSRLRNQRLRHSRCGAERFCSVALESGGGGGCGPVRSRSYATEERQRAQSFVSSDACRLDAPIHVLNRVRVRSCPCCASRSTNAKAGQVGQGSHARNLGAAAAQQARGRAASARPAEQRGGTLYRPTAAAAPLRRCNCPCASSLEACLRCTEHNDRLSSTRPAQIRSPSISYSPAPGGASPGSIARRQQRWPKKPSAPQSRRISGIAITARFGGRGIASSGGLRTRPSWDSGCGGARSGGGKCATARSVLLRSDPVAALPRALAIAAAPNGAARGTALGVLNCGSEGGAGRSVPSSERTAPCAANDSGARRSARAHGALPGAPAGGSSGVWNAAPGLGLRAARSGSEVAL